MTIVIGIDGSSGGAAALRWAVEEARLHGSALHAIHVVAPPLAYAGAGADMGVIEPRLQQEAEALLGEALGEAGLAASSDVVVKRELRTGQPARVLLELGERADLLVLGGRGAQGFQGLLLGSTAEHCARHASCPVAVIPLTSPPPAGRIVVGVDGSAAASAALAWAAAEAERRGAVLEVIGVCEPARKGAYGAELMDAAAPGWRRRLHDQIRATIDDAIAGVPRPDGVEIVREVVDGQPSVVLAERSRTSDLVVVGSRGRGGFAGLLLGSVSRQVLHHAACPVVVVR